MGRNNLNDRQRQLMSFLPKYALRKTKLGCVSVLIAVGFFLGGTNEMTVKADTLTSQDQNNKATATIPNAQATVSTNALTLRSSMNTLLNSASNTTADSGLTASTSAATGTQTAASSAVKAPTATSQAADLAATKNAASTSKSENTTAADSVSPEQVKDSVSVATSAVPVQTSTSTSANIVPAKNLESAQTVAARTSTGKLLPAQGMKISAPVGSDARLHDKQAAAAMPVKKPAQTTNSAVKTAASVQNVNSAASKVIPTVLAASDSANSSLAEDVTVDAKNFSQYFDAHGTATYQLNPDGSVTITFTKKGQEYSAGGVSLKEKINMDSSFTLNGQINLGDFGGADGMGIVFHTGSVAALGRPGGNLGIAGLPNAVGFKLDSYFDYYNEPTSDLPGDEIPLPTNGHGDEKHGQSQDPTTAVPYGDIVTTSHEQVTTTTGKEAWRWWVNNQDGTVKPLTTSLMDGKFHNFQMQYNGQTHVLTIRLQEPAGHLNDSAQTPESEQWVEWSYQIPNIPGNGNVAMALDLTATTGELTNLQQFKLTSFTFSPAASVNVKYVNEKGQVIHQADVHYNGAPVIGNTYSTDQLNLPGYTYIGLGKGSIAPSGTLSKEGLNGTVIYVYGHTEKITVNYQDISQTDPQNLSKYDQSLSGAESKSSGYSTAGTIKKLEAKGYQLVNDPTHGKVLDYGNADQSYTVTLTHRHITIGPNDYQPNGTPLPNNAEKTYQGVEKDDLNQQSTRTIKYEFANGKQAAPTKTQTVNYTRSADIDEVTGDVTYTPWSASTDKYDAVDSPVIPGYQADPQVVGEATAKQGENPVIKVVYQPCTEQIKVVYEDISTTDPQSLGKYDRVLTGKYGSSSDYSTADTIKALEQQGYQLVDDPTNGQILSFDNTSKKTYVIKLKRKSATDHHSSGSNNKPSQKPTDQQGKGTASAVGNSQTTGNQAGHSQIEQTSSSHVGQVVQAHRTVISNNKTTSATQLTNNSNNSTASTPNEAAPIKHLPQTGNRRDDSLGILGLLLATIGGWLGFDANRKRSGMHQGG
ncbi:MucBP domain-containing protein [Limosilactobacillus mucosae]|uniref:MucBP domain-containing protein n=1 Tax=Limosilactobacillus mucosae TaxID=97478 RepID=A0AAJ1HVY6_LIMMU|nr:MucBP domain-containing protein [Limosilactobacillus mucosae]MDC2830346.1 MucBP domain-containing protein [Limosilactobacillus mucosae]MDC2837920.1 MucBP domain-containing protein [Limosilactobacillus mucosae]MDC2849933.1 MucBP domain-containing protein [Limosilactobacillus mucosae]MDC2854163.1 MucBP domain-containing protein [Limosilactobacillus mucosae]